MVKKKAKQSRYERVIEILNDAQGSGNPDYQGYEGFWRCIETFKQAVIYGQHMIAAAPSKQHPSSESKGDGKCCGANADTDTQVDTGAAVEAVNLEPGPDSTTPSNCWPSGGSSRSDGSNNESKRGDRSGIIIGLRGEYPFDGKIFPPLLWDAAHPVAATDIAFIAEWIDAGMPEEDDTKVEKASSIQIIDNECIALACGDKAHCVSSAPTNKDQDIQKGLHVRKEISTLTADELERFREALTCMSHYNEHWLDERGFDFWARTHTNNCQHGWELFLPWHRAYLYNFEQQLQDYDSLITLPYWSWTDYADANKATFQTEILDTGVIPVPYRCWLTSKAVGRLADTKLFSDKDIANMNGKVGISYNSGRRLLIAVEIPYAIEKNPATDKAQWSDKTRAIYNELININRLWFPNRWPGSIGSATHYPTKADVEQILAVKDWYTFGGGPEQDHHFGALEEVHNGMHNFSGGVNPDYPKTGNPLFPNPDPQNFENPPYGWMTDNRITAYDPIFWGHHSNVDRLWAKWQTQNPNGIASSFDAALPPWNLTVQDTISIQKLGYEYMRDSFHYSTESQVAMTRFNSEKAGVSQQVLDEHEKAIIRLHRVRRGDLPNVQIRVFLNQPDANCETTLINNEHYVGQVSTFHGSCFGGPGHCALPLDKTRNFDKRVIHHNEPRNFRIDATAAVQRMLAKGDTDLSVHLVMVDQLGKPMDKALYLEGVSLTFLD